MKRGYTANKSFSLSELILLLAMFSMKNIGFKKQENLLEVYLIS